MRKLEITDPDIMGMAIQDEIMRSKELRYYGQHNAFPFLPRCLPLTFVRRSSAGDGNI